VNTHFQIQAGNSLNTLSHNDYRKFMSHPEEIGAVSMTEIISMRGTGSPIRAVFFESDSDLDESDEESILQTMNKSAFSSIDVEGGFGSSPDTSLFSITEDLTAAAREAAAALSTCASLYDTSSFSCEVDRIAELERMRQLDTIPEARFDTITGLLAAAFDVPVCVVSLVDVNRGWFKSNWGPFPGCVGREGSFCSYITVPDRHEILVVPDCTKDARFADNPYVAGPPELRYYSGAPLVTSKGHRIGTLCMCDFKPRYFPASAYNIVLNFAEVVVRELEKGIVTEDLRRRNSQPIPDSIQDVVLSSSDGITNEQGSQERRLKNAGGVPVMGVEQQQEPAAIGLLATAVEDEKAIVASLVPTAREPVMLMRTSDPSWPLIYTNEAWADLVGEASTPSSFKDLFVPSDPSDGWESIEEKLSKGLSCSAFMHLSQDVQISSPQNEKLPPPPLYRIRFHLAARDTLENSIPVGIPGFIAANESCPHAERVPALELESLWICTAHGVWTDSPMSSRSWGRTSNDEDLEGFSPFSRGVSIAKRNSLDGDWTPQLTARPAQWSQLTMGPMIGMGSYGRVFRGLLGDKPVAIKSMKIELSDITKINSISESGNSEMSIQQAVLEAVLSKQLAHPSIVPTIDFSISQSTPGVTQIWILQHLCDKGNLYDNLDRGFFRENASLTSPPSLSTILSAAQDIASGLVYLHDNNIVHGDLSGNNVLLSSSRNERGFKALLCDFGFSRSIEHEIQTKAIGTISHMPLELIVGGLLTKKADTYAFGVLLIEMWQGKRAFAGMNPATIFFRLTHNTANLTLPDDCPDELKTLVAACLDADPNKRPEMHDVLAQLQTLASVSPPSSPTRLS
jgi:GAF domain-containing protein